MGSQLFVNVAEVRQGPFRFGRFTAAKQQFVEFVFAHAVRQRPFQAGCLGAFQVFRDRAQPEQTAAGDLAVVEPQIVSEPEHFGDLAHGRPFSGQSDSPCGNKIRPPCCCPAPFPRPVRTCRNAVRAPLESCSDFPGIPVRLRSECVFGLDWNSRSASIGIPVRLPSESLFSFVRNTHPIRARP